MLTFLARYGFVLALIHSMTACKTPRPAVPGHTPYAVADVLFNGATIGLGELPVKLGMRAGNVLIPSQNYNVYRAQEDKRRVLAYWKTRGYLDATVEGPLVVKDEANQEVVVTWKITEGERYRIGSVAVEGAPEHLRQRLEETVPFKGGDVVDDVQAWRLHRVTMSELMRANGFAHAETFSRLFIHKEKRRIHWIYYIDAGPKTRVGDITIVGAHKIPKATILHRLGLRKGDPYDHSVRARAHMDLLDMGSFNVVRIEDNVDNEFLIGALPPDLGGTFRPGHVGADGKVLPRSLSADVNLRVHVQEAPAHKGRLGLGASADMGRLDGHISFKNEFRDLFGATHHLNLGGRMAYGWLFDGAANDPLGFYGQGTIRYDTPGVFIRNLDLRVYGTWREQLREGYRNRGLRTGVGFRTSLSVRSFLDVDLAYRLEWPEGLPALNDDQRSTARLDMADLSAPELKVSFVWDGRDNRVEALSGSLLALDAAASPWGGSHGYASLGLNARTFLPLGNAMAIGVKGHGRWVFDLNDSGLPPAVRLFGGGSFGMRGYGQNGLTSMLTECIGDKCRLWGVGALSLFEASIDFRWLPFRKQFGANAFVDVGGASTTANPFDKGVSVAVGLGARVRLWYVPLSLDLGYRVLEPEELSEHSSWLFFMRLGESF